VFAKVDGKPDWDEKHYLERDTYLRSSEDLAAFMQKADERLGRRAESETVYVYLQFSENEPLPKPTRARKPRERLTGAFYVVMYNNNYIARLSKSTLRYGASVDYAKQFKTAREAEKWIAKRNLAKRFDAEFSVEKVA
jgi:hypothetical protein